MIKFRLICNKNLFEKKTYFPCCQNKAVSFILSICWNRTFLNHNAQEMVFWLMRPLSFYFNP